MTKTEKAVTWAIAIADNHAHGYDQVHRWGPDYDCSSLIISAWQQAGVPVRTNGASYTGNRLCCISACVMRIYRYNNFKYLTFYLFPLFFHIHIIIPFNFI